MHLLSMFLSLAATDVYVEPIPDGTPAKFYLREVSDDEALERRAARRAAPSDSAPDKELDALERALLRATELGPSDRLRVSFRLEQGFDLGPHFDEWPIEPEDRRWLGSEIRAANAPRLWEFLTVLEEAGAAVRSYSLLFNVVHADVPAPALAALVVADGVVYATADTLDPQQARDDAAGYDGVERRSAFRAQSVFLDDAFSGERGNRINTSLPTVIAVIEGIFSGETRSGERLHNHRGFLDSSSGGARIFERYFCNATSCTSGEAFASTSASNNHGTIVAGVALGSIEQGQDLSFPGSGTTSQRLRSGLSKETDAVYLTFDGTDEALSRALETAWDATADVAVLPFHLAETCSRTHDAGDVNFTIDFVSGLGMTLFVAGGNDADTITGCSVHWPATRPPVITVGALDTDDGDDYSNTLRDSSSGDGHMSVIVDGQTRQITLVDVLAPGKVSYYYDKAGYGSSTAWVSGTSFAAPAVSGALTLWLTARHDLGFSAADTAKTGVKRAALALAADNNTGYTAGGLSVAGTTDRGGFGRARLFRPVNDGLVNDSDGLQMGSVTFSTGATASVVIQEATLDPVQSFEHFEAVMLWDETGSLSNCADIKFHVESDCGNLTVGDDDETYNFTKQIFIPPGQNAYCATLVIEPIHIPSSRKVYWAFAHKDSSSP